MPITLPVGRRGPVCAPVRLKNSEDFRVESEVRRVRNDCVHVVDDSRLDVSAPRAGEGERKRKRKCRIENGHCMSERQRMRQNESVCKRSTTWKRICLKMCLILWIYRLENVNVFDIVNKSKKQEICRTRKTLSTLVIAS